MLILSEWPVYHDRIRCRDVLSKGEHGDGYAGAFNRRHRRLGQLFHNRYKSILCQEDAYLLELTRYIHLNPMRAHIIKRVDELDSYPYSGHSCLMGEQPNDWQTSEKLLGMFGDRLSNARRAYRSYIEKGLPVGRRAELTGGGLIRSSGGWGTVKASRKMRAHLKGDERILGDSDFVQLVLDSHKENLERRHLLNRQGLNLQKVIEMVAQARGIDGRVIRTPGKQPQVAEARSIVCHLAVRELGMTGVEISRELGICRSAVSKAVVRGLVLAERYGIGIGIK